MNFLKNKQLVSVSVIVVSLIVCVISVFVGIKIKNSKLTFKIENSVKQIGELKTLNKKKDKFTYNIKYPFFKNKKINYAANILLKKELVNFYKQKNKKNNKTYFFSDYNSYYFNKGKTASICYHILTKDKKEVLKKVKTISFSSGVPLTIYDIFKKSEMKKVVMEIKKEIRNNKNWSNIIKKYSINIDEKIPYRIESLKNFLVKDDSIEFYFNSGVVLPNKYGIISVNIPNKQLKDTFLRTYYRLNTKEGQLEIKNFQNSKQPLIALTFDDGPKKETTPKILDTLEKYGAHATFFVVGKKAKSCPEILKRQIANGHEIANHTYSHPMLTKLSPKNIEAEVFKTDKIVENIVNRKPQLLRAPYGSVNNKVKEIVNKPLIYWSIDTKDWQTKNAQKTVDTVLKKATDGDIVLMHDIVASTPKAAEKIVVELTNRGFLLVTVSEMFELKNITLEKGKQHVKAITKN